MLPFKSKQECASHKSQLRTLSQTALANLTAEHSVGDATVIWLYLLNEQLVGAVDLNLRLEVLKSLGKIASEFDPDQISYAPDEFTKLLHSVSAIRLPGKLAPIKALIFHQLTGVVSRKSGKALTNAHIYLAGALDPSMRRFADPIIATFLDFDQKFGLPKFTPLFEFFAKTSTLLAAWRHWDLASLHAKCAVAVSDPAKNPRLIAQVVLLHLIAFRSTSNILPGMILGGHDHKHSPAVVPMLQAFDQANSLRVNHQFEALAVAVCNENSLESLLEPLQDAYKITWLEALHKVMPKCLRAQVDKCFMFDMALLDRGYNAEVSYTDDKQQVFEIIKTAEDQWETLENVLVVTRRLTQRTTG